MGYNLGIDPGPHWWKASALTTAPALLPQYKINVNTTNSYTETVSMGSPVSVVGAKIVMQNIEEQADWID